MTTTDTPPTVIPDLSDPTTFADGVPFEAFAAIREMPGLYWQETPVATRHGGYWAVTRFADIVALERDTTTFTSTRGAAYPLTTPGPSEGPIANSIMLNDPPKHTRLRRAASKGFTPKVVKNFDPWIREIVREQIERVSTMDTFDYVEEFARTIPAYVIAQILGTPKEDREQVVEWVTAIFAATQQTEGIADGEGPLAKLAPVIQQVAAYCARIQEIKRAEPADDMFTALIGCLDRGEIDDSEFFQWLSLIIGAGFETTHTVIGQSMCMYLEDADVRSATDRAIGEGLGLRVAEEYVRLITPAMQMARTATTDVEFAGTQLREGDVMVMYFVSANRDASVFSNPDRFDPWRKEAATLAFGSGPHSCMGAFLAKLEVQILWEELAAARLHLQLDGTPRRGWSNFINQLTELPVIRAQAH